MPTRSPRAVVATPMISTRFPRCYDVLEKALSDLDGFPGGDIPFVNDPRVFVHQGVLCGGRSDVDSKISRVFGVTRKRSIAVPCHESSSVQASRDGTESSVEVNGLQHFKIHAIVSPFETLSATRELCGRVVARTVSEGNRFESFSPATRSSKDRQKTMDLSTV